MMQQATHDASADCLWDVLAQLTNFVTCKRCWESPPRPCAGLMPMELDLKFNQSDSPSWDQLQEGCPHWHLCLLLSLQMPPSTAGKEGHPLLAVVHTTSMSKHCSVTQTAAHPRRTDISTTAMLLLATKTVFAPSRKTSEVPSLETWCNVQSSVSS